MAIPLAFFNGELIPADQAVIPVYDMGFILGATVAEQLRTFGGRLYRLEQHLGRLAHSLEIVAVDPGFTFDKLRTAAEQLAAHNFELLDSDDDLGLAIFVTPGPYPTMAPDAPRRPTVCMHTYPQPFHLWYDLYELGQKLVVTSVRQIPENCWPTELKCRSRMHYYLADLEARQQNPQARALILDQDGQVLEASTANIVIYRENEGIVSPPRKKILPGVSVSSVAQLCQELQIPFVNRELSVAELDSADEIMLCSTSPCIWPVTELNGRKIGRGIRGPICSGLLDAWSSRVGLDIVAQAKRFRTRPNASRDGVG